MPSGPEPLEEPVQHVDGGAGVVQRAVAWATWWREKNGARVASLQLGTSSRVSSRRARTAVSTEAAGGQAMPGLRAGGLEEAEVERGVVGDQHRAAGELEERRQDRADAGRRGDHHRGDPGEHADVGRDLPARVDQGLELAEHLAAADLHRADLGDRAVLRRAAGGLEVDDDEGDVGQRRAQVVDGVPRSYTCVVAADGSGGGGHGQRTVGRGNDTLVMPRRGPAPARRVRGVARPGDQGAAHLADRPCQDTICPGGPSSRAPRTRRWSDAPALRVAHPRAVVLLVAAGGRRVSVLAAGGPAAADPSDQPGGTSGVLDSRALDELQQRAAEVQAGLQAAAGRGDRRPRRAGRRPSRPSPTPQKVVDDAEGELAGYQARGGRLRVGAVPGRRRR